MASGHKKSGAGSNRHRSRGAMTLLCPGQSPTAQFGALHRRGGKKHRRVLLRRQRRQ